MQGYQPSTYGEAIADLYDDFWGRRVDYAAASTFLFDHAGGGPVLELGVGTGLFATQLVKRGLEVHGVEISEAMVKRLRSTPEGQRVNVSTSDFEQLSLGRTFPLVYSTFCSFPMSILSAEGQRAAMQKVAQHVAKGGHLVIEQKAAAWTPNQLKVRNLSADRVVLMVTDYDAVSQKLSASHVVFAQGAVRLIPYSVRYCSAAELDLMAQLAGLELVARYGGWNREPFTAASADHISVYAR
jgi:phospholipid N-methyltransferase